PTPASGSASAGATAPNLVAAEDPNLGTPGILRLETGRYSPENLTYGRLVVQGHLAAAGMIRLNFTVGYNSLASPSWFNPATPLVDATTFNGAFTSFEIQGIDPSLFNEAQFAQVMPAGLYSAIPEPSTYALIAAAAALLATGAIRRR
ncbi:MAG: PEP-CTERM sorting domain-containing protein, partial [Candidatus Saccharimonas sp.]|nr:PEP-CTERM sorting domain-containing protein [Planctomycetaceae bacterium]